jgi:hypothetical protein
VTSDELVKFLCSRLGCEAHELLPKVVRLQEDLKNALEMLEDQDMEIWISHSTYDPQQDAIGHDFMSGPEEVESRRCTCETEHWHTWGCWCGPRSWHKPEPKTA